MKHAVHVVERAAEGARIADIRLDQVGGRAELRAEPGGEIIEHPHAYPAGQQGVGQMRSDKTCATSYEDGARDALRARLDHRTRYVTGRRIKRRFAGRDPRRSFTTLPHGRVNPGLQLRRIVHRIKL